MIISNNIKRRPEQISLLRVALKYCKIPPSSFKDLCKWKIINSCYHLLFNHVDSSCFFFVRAVLQLRSITSSIVRMAAQYYPFGGYKISESGVFYSTQLAFAFVNMCPVRPDVLVCPKREVKRVADLSADEICDLWLTAQKIGRQLESYDNASSLTLNIQDGPQAGQSVPHVHIHVIPRRDGDFENNDDIYDEIDLKEKQLKRRLDNEESSDSSSLEGVAARADEYRKLFS